VAAVLGAQVTATDLKDNLDLLQQNFDNNGALQTEWRSCRED
jgi:hypothetical protein